VQYDWILGCVCIGTQRKVSSTYDALRVFSWRGKYMKNVHPQNVIGKRIVFTIFLFKLQNVTLSVGGVPTMMKIGCR